MSLEYSVSGNESVDCAECVSGWAHVGRLKVVVVYSRLFT